MPLSKLFEKILKPQKKYVVYTSLYGNYETLNEQDVEIEPDIDFICFTDNADLQSSTWKIRLVATHDLDHARRSRLPKLVPHRYLSDYRYSLYIDNTVKLKGSLRQLFEIITSSPQKLFAFPHPWSDCIYDEAEVSIANMYDDERRIREQLDFYAEKGFPKHAGLVCGTMLLRDHNDKKIVEFCEDWLVHVLRFSKRDQISFPYNAWKHDLSYGLLEGALTDNKWMTWPVHNNRLPYGFDENTYLWLNPDVFAAGMDARTHYLQNGHQENRPLHYHHIIEIDRLANKYKSDKGTLYYNKHFYSRVYDRYFTSMRNESFSLLEIGLLRHDIQARNPTGPYDDAPSLKMWSDYFDSAEIHGFDIQDFSAAEEGRIKVTQGDQFSRVDLLSAVERCNLPLRVVIDDGSHASHHQQASLGYLFSYLRLGGLYIIEDLHYQPPSLEKDGAMKTLDCLKLFLNTGKIQSPYISVEDARRLEADIESIEFYDSMDYNAKDLGRDALAVIRKRSA